MKAKWVRSKLIVFLALVCLSGCALDRVAAQQEEATGLWDELIGGESFGQSFLCAHEDLYRIDVNTATYARINSAPVVFHLRSGPEASSDIVSITLSASAIQNERPTSIVFSPLPDSRGKAYYFYIESPEAMPGNAITVYANAYDQYSDGMAYRNGQAVNGDLAFTAYSRQAFTLSLMMRDFLSRVAQDVPFFACYGILILGVCVALIACLRRERTVAATPGITDSGGRT